MESNNILFCIVCFREKFWETESFRDLVNSYQISQSQLNLNIHVFDNTDIEKWSIEDYVPIYNINIHYTHNSKNPGISAAFNYFANFANEKAFEWLVFLDQDTTLPRCFYQTYLDNTKHIKNNWIAFPLVSTTKCLISPSYYFLYRTKVIKKELLNEIELNSVTAINSGLMIKTQKFLEYGGYNENLRIDFCDHEFIERLNGKKIFATILAVNLQQDFSAETNNKKKSIERYKMYTKDLKNYRKNKNKLLFFLRVDFPRLLKEIYKNKSLEFLKIRLDA